MLIIAALFSGLVGASTESLAETMGRPNSSVSVPATVKLSLYPPMEVRRARSARSARSDPSKLAPTPKAPASK